MKFGIFLLMQSPDMLPSSEIYGNALEQVQMADQLGFDTGINFKTENLDSALGAACPLGVDVYFENVGGVVTDTVFDHLNVGARISICGPISQTKQNRDRAAWEC